MPQQAQSMPRQKPIYKCEDLDCRTCSREVDGKSDMWQEFLGVIRLFHKLGHMYIEPSSCNIDVSSEYGSCRMNFMGIPPAEEIIAIADGRRPRLDPEGANSNEQIRQIKKNGGPSRFNIRVDFGRAIYEPRDLPGLILIPNIMVPSNPEEFKKVTSLEEFAGFEF